MTRKLTALLAAALLALSLTACGSQAADSSASGETGGTSSSAVTQPDASQEVPDGSVSAPEETPDADAAKQPEKPQQENLSSRPPESGSAPSRPSGSKPSGGNTPSGPAGSAPSGGSSADSGSGGSAESGSKDLSAFYDTLSADPDFPALTQLTGEALDSLYAGLSDLKPKQCLVYMPMISAVAYEIALVEAASADGAQAVRDIFQSRIDYQIQQGAFYPATVEAWQNSAQIAANGRYVLLICGSNAADVVKNFQNLF